MLAEKSKVVRSFAFKRLEATLLLWERNKIQNQYEYIYICARIQGKKIKAVWVSKEDDIRSTIEKHFGTALNDATSFEVEFMFDPQVRQLELSKKNQWNSLRGKFSAIVSYAGKITKWSSLEMIAKNLSFNRVAYHHLGGSDKNKQNTQFVPFTLYKTEQFYCGNENRNISQGQPSKLYRGNQVVAIGEIDQVRLLESIQTMTRWLATQVNEQGQASYKYWPSRGEYATSNNAIRQWMATVCLTRAAKVFNSDSIKNIAEKNLKYNLEAMHVEEGELGYIWMNDSAKLGSAALAALAVIESPDRKKYLKQEYSLRNLLGELSNENGSFDTFYIPRERKDNQNFYSGEALLFLATQFTITKSPTELARINSAFKYYRQWHRENRNPAFIPWHTQAYYLVWNITKDESLKDFIFEMNDWLLGIQQWGSAEYPDMQGRFYDPKRPFYGPPHASATGVYLEGLVDAFQLAKQVNDIKRAENYRVSILRGIRSIMQLQFKNEQDCFYVKNIERVLGGVRTTVYDNTIRIDNVQHALMAFFKIANSFRDDDYVNKFDKKIKLNNFRRLNYEIPFNSISLEVERNNNLWGGNTSREDNLKVQRETNTIFLRSTKKPLPNGVFGEDFHVDGETSVASNFPVLMDTLYQFAKTVNGSLARATIVRLKPSGRVYPHIDEGDYYKYRDRYHIVVKSLDGSEMVSGGEFVTWKQGEFWWFDNKKCHEAFNQSNEYRVHIIFDILPDYSKGLVEKIVDKYKLVQANGYYREDKIFSHLIDGRKVELPSPVLNGGKQESVGELFVKNYKTNSIFISKHDNVFLLGNKFVVVDEHFRVLESSLPTYHQKPDVNWANRKKPFISSLLKKEIIEVDYPVAIVANSSWKNYWHWHVQCLPSIKAIQDSEIGDEVRFIVPRLNSWRSASLASLGISPDRIIKAHDSIFKLKRAYRPNLLNKKNQAHADPFLINTFDSIKTSVIGHHELSRRPFRKLYVSRQDCLERRKLSNENQLISALQLLGFEVVVPGEMTYLEQVGAFSDAEIVVGAHGAGLTNIGFCKPNTILVELFPRYFCYDEKIAYYTLATIKKMKYFAFISDELSFDSDYSRANSCFNNKMAGNFDWVIDIDELFGFMRNTGSVVPPKII